jgi:hypothetical protein
MKWKLHENFNRLQRQGHSRPDMAKELNFVVELVFDMGPVRMNGQSMGGLAGQLDRAGAVIT